MNSNLLGRQRLSVIESMVWHGTAPGRTGCVSQLKTMGKSVLEEHFLNKSMRTVPINPNATSFSKTQNRRIVRSAEKVGR